VTTYFADTSFWIALSSKRDQYHSQALAWHAAITRTGSKTVTTEAVPVGMAERTFGLQHPWCSSGGLLSSPCGSERGGGAISDGTDRRCCRSLRSASRQGWSLTDCFSFVVMDRSRLTEALTTDRHFEQANLRARMLEQPARLNLAIIRPRFTHISGCYQCLCGVK